MSLLVGFDDEGDGPHHDSKSMQIHQNGVYRLLMFSPKRIYFYSSITFFQK